MLLVLVVQQHQRVVVERLGQAHPFHRATVASEADALRPCDEVPLVVGRREREHHPQHRHAAVDEPDRHRTPTMRLQIRTGPVVGIDQPEHPASIERLLARLLTAVSPIGIPAHQTRADEPLRLLIHVGVVSAAAGTTPSPPLRQKQCPGLLCRLDRHPEGRFQGLLRRGPRHRPYSFRAHARTAATCST